MGFDEGRINHHVIILGVFEQPGEHRFPDSIFSPSAKPFVAAFPVAVTLRHIVPVRPASQDPHHPIEKTVIVLGSASGITRFTGKNVTDALKLFFGQFISFGHPAHLPYSPFSYNLECRLALGNDWRDIAADLKRHEANLRLLQLS
jgi:hypothetical protein